MTFNNNDKFFAWFLGFCDAECSFICNLVPRINKESIITSYRVFYRIQIGLNIIDKPILELINKKLGKIGKIYDYPDKKESTLSITSHESIKTMIENVLSKNIDTDESKGTDDFINFEITNDKLEDEIFN